LTGGLASFTTATREEVNSMRGETREYDLIAIGGGPAGMTGVTVASVHGKTVAVVESHKELGGASINTGTVPSKTLRETALALSGMRSRKLYGVDLSLRREVTVADFLRHERHVKAGLNAMLSKRLEAYQADVYHGTATFVDPHTVRLTAQPLARGGHPLPSADGDVLLRGERLLIATGSAPVRPPMFPFGPGVYDSDTILELDRLPRTMAVVGAGVIGSEYACTFAALGVQVHVIDGRDVLLPFLDAEVSRSLAAVMAGDGIVFHWKERVQACNAVQPGSPQEPGTFALTLGSGKSLTVDAVLVAAGRKGNVEELNLSAAGVAVGDRGLVHVDEHFRTNVPHVYAAGDIIGFPALASTSAEQARRAVRHALGLAIRSEISHLLPNGIYTIPEVAMVGETEESLSRQGVDHVVGRASYLDSGRGRIIGDSDGFLKLLFRREDMKLLGVHVLGEQATEVVHIGLMAMIAGATAVMFDEACFNLPTLGALYKNATFDAMLNVERAGATPPPGAEARLV
jgi:NAD(P) transhydrogenase